MNTLELNRVAIWKPKLTDGFSVRESASGRVAYEDKIAYRTNAKTYRYAKNYELGKGKTKTKICLFYVSYESDAEEAEKFLDKTAKKIDVATAQQAVIGSTNTSFEYLDIYKENK